MARCGCGNSCSCVLVPGDNVNIEGTGDADFPYKISADLGAFEDFTGVLTVNGQGGPNVVLNAEDVYADMPWLYVAIRTASGTATMGAINPFKATNADLTATLPLLTDDDTNHRRRIMIEKDMTDTSGRTLTVTAPSPDAFIGGGQTTTLVDPSEKVWLMAVKVGTVRYWKIVSRTFPKPVAAAAAPAGGVNLAASNYTAAGWTRVTSTATNDTGTFPTRNGVQAGSTAGTLVVPATGYYHVAGRAIFNAGSSNVSGARRGISVTAGTSTDPDNTVNALTEHENVASNTLTSLIATGPMYLTAGTELALWRYTDSGNNYVSTTGMWIRAVQIG